MESQPSCPQCGEPVEVDWAFCANCGYSPGDVIVERRDDEPQFGAASLPPVRPPAPPPAGDAGPSFAPPQRSVFSVNRNVVIAVSAVAAVVLLGGLFLMFRSGSSSTVDAGPAGPTGTTAPGLGELKLGEKPSTTTTAPVVTTIPCDSKTSVKSTDGKGYFACDGGFTVDFSGRPEITVRKEELQAGVVTWHIYTSTSLAQRLPGATEQQVTRQVVIYGDLGHEPTPEEAKVVLGAAMNQLNAKPAGDAMVAGHPGVSFTGTDGEWRIKGGAFVAGTKVYGVAVLGVRPITNEYDAFAGTFSVA